MPQFFFVLVFFFFFICLLFCFVFLRTSPDTFKANLQFRLVSSFKWFLLTVPSEVHSMCQVNRNVGSLPTEEKLLHKEQLHGMNKNQCSF